jgi:23S rRNA (cytosine1962-C5)-methyltransferase
MFPDLNGSCQRQMNEEKFQMFRNRLTKNYRHLGKLARRQEISCYRVYDHDLPEFPFCIEIYDGRIYLAEYRRRHGMTEEEHDAWTEDCAGLVSSILGIALENIYWKQRQRKAGRQGQYAKLASEGDFFTVTESGLRFRVNLSDYLDTGLYLDHRTTRQMVRSESSGKQVLNLFSYTGSFSVYAGSGGAAGVSSVDLSRTYLQWSEINMGLNGLTDPGRYRFIQADVKQLLDRLPADFHDLVIMDPPTFSNSKRMKDFLDIQQDHVELLNKTLLTLKPGGSILFSTNFRRFRLEADKIQASSCKDITRMTTPFDFEGRLPRVCFRFVK